MPLKFRATLNPACFEVSIWSGQKGYYFFICMACAVYLKRHLQHRQCTPAALQSVLDYHSTVFKYVCIFVVHAVVVVVIVESIVNKSSCYEMRPVCSSSYYKRHTHTNKHVSHTCNCLHFSAWLWLMWMSTFFRYCFGPMLGGECASPGSLWQAEAESSTLLSRTVQDKGPLPPVWG